MKTMKKFLSMAALALMGAVMTGCSNNDDSFDTPQQPENNIVTLTATIGFEGNAGTRALTSGGVKTFAEGEQIALIYKNTNGNTVKAVSAALRNEDISFSDDSKKATFTFVVENADITKDVTYIYPAAMAKGDGTPNYDALTDNEHPQDGTLETIASNLDLATYTHQWYGSELPVGTLKNQLAICSFTLKDHDGTNEITSSITGMTVYDGTNTYTVSRSAVAGPIYVAMKPVTTEYSLKINANDGSSNNYEKNDVTSRTYNAGSFNNLILRMTQVQNP